MRARRGGGWRGQTPAEQGASARIGRPHKINAGRGRLDKRRVGGDSLLKQQLGGADHGLKMEPTWHRIVEQDVGQGDKAHPLVVGHV